MKIHEYQAKEILARYGIEVPGGRVAAAAEEAAGIASELGGERWVVKAQVHAGGRGKGGGIRLCSTVAEVKERSAAMLGSRLVTPQTGAEGKPVRKVLVTEAVRIAREYYVGVVLDRRKGIPVLMASAEGGVEIEEVAAKDPEKIFREDVDPLGGLSGGGLEVWQGRRLAAKMGFAEKQLSACAAICVRLVRSFLETDASLAEINPLVVTEDGRLLALDAKYSFDDNALYRHPEIKELRDVDEEDPLEVRAGEFDLSYIRLDGNIGCMVNGAGLAMATLDIVSHHGGQPANFLDVGGGATTEKVTEAFRIIVEDPRVRVILVNIFGGIMKCDVIAEGILAAAEDIDLRVPVVVRLEGTNVERGKSLLDRSKLNLVSAGSLAEAAGKAVELAGRQP